MYGVYAYATNEYANTKNLVLLIYPFCPSDSPVSCIVPIFNPASNAFSCDDSPFEAGESIISPLEPHCD